MKNDLTTSFGPLEVFCPHCEVDLMGDEPVRESGAVPGEGDCGVCSSCWKWWVIQDGKRVKYTPNQEEQETLQAYLKEKK